MSTPEKREAARRIKKSMRRSSELCRVRERELLHHTDRDDRFWEAAVAAETSRMYGQIVTAICGGLLDQDAEGGAK